jgi:hypothetical protein
MQASGARGSIGKASYEAVRKHIDAGKKATEAFRLVAQETGRSTATVQTAYYRVARSLPGGGGVQLRPRKKTAARRAAAKVKAAGKPAARRGRPPKNQSAAPTGSAAAIARQLSNAAEALVAHISRLESELAEARKDRERLVAIERALGR